MTVVSLVLVVAGILGAGLAGQPWMMALVFVGLFGPFLSREIGLVRWRDDFQREAVMRSGMHALVAVGVLLTLSAILEGGGTDLGQQPAGDWARVPAGLVLMVAGITWGLSWLLQFWGVRTGAYRILLWTMAVFTAISIAAGFQMYRMGSAPGWDATALLIVQVAVGWALVLASRRWPRTTGALLIGIAAVMLWQIVPALDTIGHQVAIFGVSFLVLPFLVPSIALLASRGMTPDVDEV